MKKAVALFSIIAIFSSSAIGMELDISAGTTSTQTIATLENNYLGGVNVGNNGTLLIQQVGVGAYRPTQGYNGIKGPGGVTINATPNPDIAVIQFTGLPINYSDSTTREAGTLKG